MSEVISTLHVLHCYFHTSSLYCCGVCWALMSVFSILSGLEKSQNVRSVQANISGSQYTSASDPISGPARHVGTLHIPLARSLLFCLSLQMGLSLEQDVLYMLMYAFGSEAVALMRTGEVRDTICKVTCVVSTSLAVSLLARSVLSFYKSRPPPLRIDVGEPKPMFFPVQTSHTRLFPQVHRLSYPFMWTGIPVGFRGNIGGVLSCERRIEKFPPGWFTIDACDYMHRCSGQIGLERKLHEFLISRVRTLS